MEGKTELERFITASRDDSAEDGSAAFSGEDTLFGGDHADIYEGDSEPAFPYDHDDEGEDAGFFPDYEDYADDVVTEYIPSSSEERQAFEKTELPETRETPEEPEMQEMPEMPEAEEIPETPEIQQTQEEQEPEEYGEEEYDVPVAAGEREPLLSGEREMPPRSPKSETGAAYAGASYEKEYSYPGADAHSQPSYAAPAGSAVPAPPYVVKGSSRGVLGLGIVNLIVASVTLCAIAAGIYIGSGYIASMKADSEEQQKQIEKLEKEKSLLESDYIEAMSIINEPEPEVTLPVGDSVDSGKILLYDTDIGYIWVPVLSVLPQNTYRKDGFSVDERGRMSYTDRGEASSYFGIDVSSYQGDIDWQLAKEDGVEFAFLRIGYRGYGEEGNMRVDDKFAQNYEAAHEAGVDLGVYFFSQAITAEEAAEEARFLLAELDGRTLEYPIVYDWESVLTAPDETARTDDVMPQTLTLCARAFCETIKDAGYDAMLYTNKKTAVMKYDMRHLSDYPVWLAYYDTTLNYCYEFDIWQYGTGEVDGIEGEVDLNIAMIK